MKKDDTLTRDELRNHCRQYLTGYKIPKEIEFRDELPKLMLVRFYVGFYAMKKSQNVQNINVKMG